MVAPYTACLPCWPPAYRWKSLGCSTKVTCLSSGRTAAAMVWISSGVIVRSSVDALDIGEGTFLVHNIAIDPSQPGVVVLQIFFLVARSCSRLGKICLDGPFSRRSLISAKTAVSSTTRVGSAVKVMRVPYYPWAKVLQSKKCRRRRCRRASRKSSRTIMSSTRAMACSATLPSPWCERAIEIDLHFAARVDTGVDCPRLPFPAAPDPCHAMIWPSSAGSAPK